MAFLAARTRDVAGAEDALSGAFSAALEDWPVNGVPRTPEAWLLTAARRKLIDAARKRDEGLNVATEASCCKLFASEMCGRVADRAVQIFGGAGYLSEYGIERFYRDVRIFRIYEGTSQIQQVVIARETLKRGG